MLDSTKIAKAQQAIDAAQQLLDDALAKIDKSQLDGPSGSVCMAKGALDAASKALKA